MTVQLKELKPNPFRDFKVDPIEEEVVENLAESIRSHGFWGGVVCRRVNGYIEIAAGHHRVNAALEAGIDEADLFVSDRMDDDSIVLVYARENALQRGNTGTARAGSVAAAIRKIAYDLLAEKGGPDLGHLSGHGPSERLGSLLKGDGIGWRILEEKLKEAGLKKWMIGEDLASLKESGHYARIIAEVAERVTVEKEKAEQQAAAAQNEEEREKAEAAAAAARRAQQAARTAAEKARRFDFEGVSRHFKEPKQVSAFRKMILKPALQAIVPVDRQAEVAATLIQRAEELKQEPDTRFIQERLHELVRDVYTKPDATAEEKHLGEEEWHREARARQNLFLSALRGAVIQGEKFLDHLSSVPEGHVFSINWDIREQIRRARAVFSELEEK